jgi:hypothetical protein
VFLFPREHAPEKHSQKGAAKERASGAGEGGGGGDPPQLRSKLQ